jgi:hypothetical protein
MVALTTPELNNPRSPSPNPAPPLSSDRDAPAAEARRTDYRRPRIPRLSDPGAHDCPISRVQRGASDNRGADPELFVRSAAPGAAIRTIDDHDNTRRPR